MGWVVSHRRGGVGELVPSHDCSHWASKGGSLECPGNVPGCLIVLASQLGVKLEVCNGSPLSNPHSQLWSWEVIVGRCEPLSLSLYLR